MLENLTTISINIILFLQSTAAWLTPIMRFFTFLGNQEFYILVMPVFLWAIDYDAGVRLGLMMLFSGSLNTTLKNTFGSPRPYWLDSNIHNLDIPYDSLSFPSGHSQNAATLFGLLAAWVKKKWHSWIMVLIAVMVAFSRLYLGVHSLADIVSGLLVGAILVIAYLKFNVPVAVMLKRQKVITRIVIAIAFSLLLLLITVGITNYQQMNFTVQPVWSENARFAGHTDDIHPFELDGILTSTGALLGVSLGSIWMNATGGFVANQGDWWKRGMRFIIGLLGVLLFWKVLGDLFPRNEDVISYILRYFRYLLVGFWVSGIAPKLFILINLAQSKKTSETPEN